jgi:hypothetical protein
LTIFYADNWIGLRLELNGVTLKLFSVPAGSRLEGVLDLDDFADLAIAKVNPLALRDVPPLLSGPVELITWNSQNRQVAWRWNSAQGGGTMAIHPRMEVKVKLKVTFQSALGVFTIAGQEFDAAQAGAIFNLEYWTPWNFADPDRRVHIEIVSPDEGVALFDEILVNEPRSENNSLFASTEIEQDNGFYLKLPDQEAEVAYRTSPEIIEVEVLVIAAT